MPATPLTDAQADRLMDAYSDPRTGDIKRRFIRRLLSGVVAVGPTILVPPVPESTKTELKARAEHEAAIIRQHREVVEAEIAALDSHAADVAGKIEMLEPAAVASFFLQELRSEARQLRELKVMLENDLRDGPILRDRYNHPIDDNARRFIAFRAKELRDLKWRNAGSLASGGEHREARVARRDALRARQIAEHEAGWRASLPGYGICAWT